MKLKQLLRDVETLIGSTLDIHYVDEQNPYGLSLDYPSMVTKDEKIFILNSIPEEFKIQAEAHELGHLYLKYSGLVKVEYPFDFGFPTSDDYFALQLNNCITHPLLIQLLEQQYGISSQLHLNLLATALDHIPQQILDRRMANDTLCLQGIGLALFDIEQTLLIYRSLAEELSQMDSAVSQSLKAARKYLSAISPELSQSQQKLYLQTFLQSLGYTPNHFRYRIFTQT